VGLLAAVGLLAGGAVAPVAAHAAPTGKTVTSESAAARAFAEEYSTALAKAHVYGTVTTAQHIAAMDAAIFSLTGRVKAYSSPKGVSLAQSGTPSYVFALPVPSLGYAFSFGSAGMSGADRFGIAVSKILTKQLKGKASCTVYSLRRGTHSGAVRVADPLRTIVGAGGDCLPVAHFHFLASHPKMVRADEKLAQVLIAVQSGLPSHAGRLSMNEVKAAFSRGMSAAINTRSHYTDAMAQYGSVDGGVFGYMKPLAVGVEKLYKDPGSIRFAVQFDGMCTVGQVPLYRSGQFLTGYEIAKYLSSAPKHVYGTKIGRGASCK